MATQEEIDDARRWLKSKAIPEAERLTGVGFIQLVKIRDGEIEPKQEIIDTINKIRSTVHPNTGRLRARRMVEAKKCEKCGANKRLHRHHIDHNPTNNKRENIQVLCASCHHRHHRKYEAKIRREQKAEESIPTPEHLVLGRDA